MIMSDQSSLIRPRVQIQFEIINIGRISTLNESFEAELIVNARWKAFNQHMISLNDDSVLVYDQKKHWNPELYIENLIKGTTSISHEITGDSLLDSYVVESQCYKGLFIFNEEKEPQ